ncbi:MAG: LysM peptidoglycan-binding domain-containing protein, partial [Planctomycetota bacterium]
MPRKHTVVQGDCIENIAFLYGFFSETVWNHPNNAKLRELRDSAVLKPGDVIVIPDLREKTIDIAAGKRHTFVRRGVPSRFRVELDLGETSIANLEYTLNIDNGTVLYHGTLDNSGRIDHPMPPDSRHAKLTVGEEVFEFDLGHLGLVEEREGII